MSQGFRVTNDRFGFLAQAKAPQLAIRFPEGARPAYAIAEDYAARWKDPHPVTFGVAMDGEFRFLPESPAEWVTMPQGRQLELITSLAERLGGFLVAQKHPPGIYFGLDLLVDSKQIVRYQVWEFAEVVRDWSDLLQRGVYCGFHPPEEVHEAVFLEFPPCSQEQVIDRANRTNWRGTLTCGFWDEKMAWLG